MTDRLDLSTNISGHWLTNLICLPTSHIDGQNWYVNPYIRILTNKFDLSAHISRYWLTSKLICLPTYQVIEWKSWSILPHLKILTSKVDLSTHISKYWLAKLIYLPTSQNIDWQSWSIYPHLKILKFDLPTHISRYWNLIYLPISQDIETWFIYPHLKILTDKAVTDQFLLKHLSDSARQQHIPCWFLQFCFRLSLASSILKGKTESKVSLLQMLMFVAAESSHVLNYSVSWQELVARKEFHDQHHHIHGSSDSSVRMLLDYIINPFL